MSNHSVNPGDQSFIALALSQDIVTRAVKVALIVGTILAIINHGEKFPTLSLSTQDLVKILFTYLVPYGVSTWSAVGAIKSKAKS